MKKILVFLTILICFCPFLTAQHRLYLLAGMGADGRSFERLELPDSIEKVYLPFLEIEKNETMTAYAQRMAAQVDTTVPYSFLGVSFGGMVPLEMGKILHPQHLFLISSAKTRRELPFRYRFQKYIPLYRLLGGGFMKKTAPFAARLFELQAGADRKLFKEMVRAKSNRFVQRSFGCIARWENTEIPENVVHLHGSKDHTLPKRRIQEAVFIEGGTHWMIWFEAKEVSRVVGGYF